jgi:hypothetical protein
MNPPKGHKIRLIGAIFLALLLLGAASTQATWSQPLGDTGQSAREGVGYTPESEGVDYTQPLLIGIKAQRRRVPRGKTAVLTVWVSPCTGRKGKPIELLRDGYPNGTRFLGRACTARFLRRVHRATTFTAAIPEETGYLGAESRHLKIRIGSSHR